MDSGIDCLEPIWQDVEPPDDIRIAYDEAVKELLSRVQTLALIARDYVDELKNEPLESIIPCIQNIQVGSTPVHQDDVVDRLQSVSVEDSSSTEGRITFDCLCQMVTGSANVKVIVNVEHQNDQSPGYPLVKRAIYYACRMISRQKGTEFKKSEYGKIKKVYSIWICPILNDLSDSTTSVLEYEIKQTLPRGCLFDSSAGKDYDLMNIKFLNIGQDFNSQTDTIKFLGTMLGKSVSNTRRSETADDMFGRLKTSDLERSITKMDETTKTMKNWAKVFAEHTEAVGLGKAAKSVAERLSISFEEALSLMGTAEDKKSVIIMALKQEGLL